MFKGTQKHKWITLAILAIIGFYLAQKYPHPTVTGQPLLWITMTLLFAKNWLEYILYLPITGLLSKSIDVVETIQRKQFVLITFIAYAILSYWLLVRLYP